MSSYLRLSLLVLCVISACSCEFFGEENIQSASPSDLLSIQDQTSIFLMANEEFTYDAFLSSVEFYATGPGKLTLGFFGFPLCGKANQPTCQSYIKDQLMGSTTFITTSSLAMMTIDVAQAGYVNYQLPAKVLVPRGYVPYIIQDSTGVNFVVTQLPDFKRYWGSGVVPIYEPLFNSAGSGLKVLIKFNVTPGVLSTDTISYGIDVPTQADANTVLTVPQSLSFFLVNAPITYDSYITSFEVFAAVAGVITINTSTFPGCQIGVGPSCAELMINYKNTSPSWVALRRMGASESARVTLKQGYNFITLTTPMFVQRKSVLSFSPSTGQVALENVNVPVSDLRFSKNSNGQYARVSENPTQAFLLRANAQYFAL